MSYQVLARKWRPADFSQMVGQEHVVQALVNALDANRLHHAYLFSGTRGVGKTTLGRIFAKALNCEQGITSSPCGDCSSCSEIDEGRSVDLLEIDAASRTGVDDMRELLDNVQYAPTRGRFKIYLIDEVHMLSKHSFNALLKTLEEPPPHIKFLLATTDPQKVPVTVLSRCLQFSLKRMSRTQILAQLQYLTEEEKIDAEPGALIRLASAADGSMRDGLSLLDQAIGYGGGAVLQSAVEAMLGSISRDYLARVFIALQAQDAATILREARAIIEHNPDYQRVCAEMLSFLQQVALFQHAPDLLVDPEFESELLRDCADKWSGEEVQLYYQILLQGRQDLLLAPDVAAGFEMLMLRLLAFAPASAVTVSIDEQKKKTEPGSDELAAPGSADVARGEKPATAPEWSRLAYDIDLGGLARQIVANSVLEIRAEDHFCLVLAPELFELATDRIEAEIRQALEQRLGVSLKLELRTSEKAAGETPQQRQAMRLEQERSAAIEAIRQESLVQKLERNFAAQLDEASVVRIEDND